MNVTINDVEKEIKVRLKLLNSKKNEFHLPASIPGRVRGVAEDF